MFDRILKLPYRGAPQTVSGIQKTAREAVLSDYSIRRQMEDICSKLDSKDYLSEILAPLYWVKAHTRYMRDPRSVELVRSPSEILWRIRRGERPGIDCDDGSALIAALQESGGVQCRITIVAFQNLMYRGERQFTHVFPEAYEPSRGAWVCSDFVPRDINAMLKRVKFARIFPM